jgi:RNA polymerase sigma-70 factor (ECF subfamily)
MNDTEAIKNCLAGETESFSFLVKKYQYEAFGHAITILGNSDDALDAVQEAFLDAFRTLKKFDVSRRFYPWLYTILRNRCFKMLATHRKEVKTEFGKLEILSIPAEKESLDKVTLVEKALLEMSPEDREILTLKHLDGLNYEIIAERLDIPVGTVMSRLYYARRRFREKVISIRKSENFRELENE